MRSLLSIVYGVLGLVVAILAVANREAVTLSLAPFPFRVEMPLFMALLGALLLGMLLVGPYEVWRRWRTQRRLARALARIAELEAGLRVQETRPALPMTSEVREPLL